MNLPGHRDRDRFIGGLIWLAGLLAIGGGLMAVAAKWNGRGGRAQSLVRFLIGRDTMVRRVAQANTVRVGAPVFYQDTDQQWRQVGQVTSTGPIASNGPLASIGPATDTANAGHGDASVTIRWYDPQLDPASFRMVAYQHRGTVAETVQVMFPKEKREAIAGMVEQSLSRHRDVLAERFLPLIEQSVRQSLPVIETEILASLRRHADEVDALGERWKDELFRQRLVPLAREQVLPIAQSHAEPVLREIGRELWDRASLWSFTWRAVYDKTPLPRRDLMREEWERFVREEAVPVIEAHADEIADALQQTIADVAKNREIRDEFGEALAAVADDPQTRRLLGVLLKETLVDNDAVRQVWIDVWTGDDARAAFESTGPLIEPLVRRLGEEIIGSPQRGIDPGFARVLRSQILGKDRQWLVAVGPMDEPTDRVLTGSGPPIYPLLSVVGGEPPE
jgi:hypothetical protein